MQLLKKLTLLLFLGFALVGCSSLNKPVENVVIPESENTQMDVHLLHQQAFKNFTYVSDGDGIDLWTVYDATKPFEGDCEDFAFSMQNLVGAGSTYGVLLYSDEEGIKNGVKVNHMVFVYAGLVWELDGIVYDIRAYEYAIGHIYFRWGDTLPEWK